MRYLDDFITIEANGQRLPIKLENKSLKGEGINTALQISFEYPQEKPLKSLKIKNAGFTDLFFRSNQHYLRSQRLRLDESYAKQANSQPYAEVLTCTL